MPTFEVTIEGVVRELMVIEVDADTEKEAEEEALGQADRTSHYEDLELTVIEVRKLNDADEVVER